MKNRRIIKVIGVFVIIIGTYISINDILFVATGICLILY